MTRVCRILCIAGAVLCIAGAVAGSASAASPWWQISTGSRPTHLWLPKSEEQELKPAATGITLVKVDGATAACIGSQCPDFGMTNSDTAQELEEALEAPYGSGNVEVIDDPETAGAFIVRSIGGNAGRYVSPITVEAFGGGPATATVTTEGGSGRLFITATNVGDAPADGDATPIVISDQLPEGFTAYHAEGIAGFRGSAGPVDCVIGGGEEVSCTFEGTLPSFEAIEIEIWVSLTGDPSTSGSAGTVSVTGGQAADLSVEQPVQIDSSPVPFGVESYSSKAEEEGGEPAVQAASHPFQLTTTIGLNGGALAPLNREKTFIEQPALPRNFRFELPAGLVANTAAVPQCTFEDFTTQEELTNNCPPETAVGAASVTLIEPTAGGLLRLAVPVFNLQPGIGRPARLGFMAAGVPVTMDASVRSENSYRVTVGVANTSQVAQILGSTVTIWGTPGDPRHDEARGWNCVYAFPKAPCTQPPDLQENAYLRLPTSCQGPLSFGMELEPWNTTLGSVIARASALASPLQGCDQVPFAPTISAQVDAGGPEVPVGLSVDLHVPQAANEGPDDIAEADVRDVEVRLPAGLQVNPAGAQGLQACSESQIGFLRTAPSGETIFNDAPVGCPDASKLGTVRVTTPLLDEDLRGFVYQAAQGANPFNSLIALYIVAEAPDAGVRVKLASKVEPTPSGLVSTVQESPQMPFEDFELDFFGGARAPLATSGCGSYVTQAEIAPWSGTPAAKPSSEFQIGGDCNPGFLPSLVAGTEEPIAGAFSPFVLRLTRGDGMQQFKALDTQLPPGLTGKLAGIPYCPEAAIAHSAGLSSPGDGLVEQQAPSCPAASRVGTVRVTSGVGPDPYPVSGDAYLAGPYKGAPLSLVTVTPAIAGPFDLGNVVVRVAMEVDPATAAITAKTDPLPTSLQGIPLGIRQIALRMDRPGFTLNPTSCRRMTVDATARSVLDQVAQLSSPFQVGACKALGFSPKVSLRFKGKTKRGGYPAIRAVVRAKKGNANIARTVVTLPPSEQIENAHISNPCTRVQFDADSCPKGSILGTATAFSPLLDEPLRGPVYFRSNGGARELPDLVADLHGQIRVILVGYIDSSKGRVRTTFANVPDAPVSKFVMSLKGGKRGLIVHNRNICARRYRAGLKMTAHNGRTRNLRPVIKTSCGKKKRKSQR